MRHSGRRVAGAVLIVGLSAVVGGCGSEDQTNATGSTDPSVATGVSASTGSAAGCGTDDPAAYEPMDRSLAPLPAAWTAQLPGQGSDEGGDAPGLAADAEVAYLGGSDGTMHAVEGDSGSLLWSADGGYGPTPTAGDETLYVGDGSGVVRALDTETGEARWSTSVGAVPGSPTVIESGVVVGADTDSSWNYAGPPSSTPVDSSGTVPTMLRALAAADGVELWHAAMPYESALAAMADDTLVVTSSDWNLVDGGGVVLGLDPASGEQRWKVDTVPFLLRPVVAGDKVLVLGSELLALDPATGEELWRLTDLGAPEAMAEQVVVAGDVAVAVVGWHIVAVDVASGRCLWREEAGTDSGYDVTALGSDLYVQETNSAPVQIDPATRHVLGWINPNASLDDPGNVDRDFCASYPTIGLVEVGDVIVATAVGVATGMRR